MFLSSHPYMPCVQRALHRSWLAIFISLATTGCANESEEEAIPAKNPLTVSDAFAAHWRDGLAEVAVYRLTQPRYGELREGEAIWVTVTEPFDSERLVKRDVADGRHLEVLKLNDMRTFETGLYDYRTMSSTFVPTTQQTPVKITASVQEWCGHVYEELRWGAERVDRTLHSYFEGEQDASDTWPQPADGWTEDAFPLMMRRSAGDPLLELGERRDIQWLPSRVGARLRNDSGAWRPAVVSRGMTPRTQPGPSGPILVDEWTVEAEGFTHRWLVEAKPPHGVVSWERSDGERGERVAVQRTDYWARQKGSDSELRLKLGLEVRGVEPMGRKPDSSALNEAP